VVGKCIRQISEAPNHCPNSTTINICKTEISDQIQILNPLTRQNLLQERHREREPRIRFHPLSTTMIQRWNRKKSHFSLIAILSLVFIVFTILYNERSIQQIQETPDHVHHRQEAPVTFVKPNRINPARGNGTRPSGSTSSQLLYCVNFLDLNFFLVFKVNFFTGIWNFFLFWLLV
jgi:hypothetical protein